MKLFKRCAAFMLAACFALLVGCAANNNTASQESYTALESLAGKRIGITTGSICDVAAQKQWPDVELQYYDSTANLLMALSQNKIGAFITDEPVARQTELTMGTVTMIPEYLMPDQYGFAFPKNDSGDKLKRNLTNL